MMVRREVIVALLLAATMPRAHAQQVAKIYRVAIVSPATPTAELTETGSLAFYSAFFQKLRQLSYVEGQNLMVERYSGEGRIERYAELAREVVRGNPDMILASSDRLAREVKAATGSIPVVTIVSDPVAIGIASSLARPGGNITGVTIDADVVGTFSRRVEFLREMVPAASRVGFLASRKEWDTPYAAAFGEAAQRMGISLVGPQLAALSEPEYRRVFATMAKEGVGALVVSAEAENLTNRRLILELAEKYRLPASYFYRDFAEMGGLMAYGVDLSDVFRHAADQVDMILKGTKPAEIPFYQPTKFALTINLKTAKVLGITVPPTLLIAADEVIE
jgi:putative ABC transport system substrate-binding protein